MAQIRVYCFAAALACFVVLTSPSFSYAVFTEADAKCAATRCQTEQNKTPCPTYKFTDTANTGVTECHCISSTPGKCVATDFNTPGGDMKGVEGLDKMLGEVFGKLMEQLMKGGGGGGGGGGEQQPFQQGDLYPKCVRNPATNTVSPIPCTESNGQINYGGGSLLDGGTLGGGSTADALLDALDGDDNDFDESINTGSNINSNGNTNSDSDTDTDTDTDTSSTSDADTNVEATPNASSQGQQSLSQGGSVLQGDILVGGSGGTLLARSRDPQSNTEVAGFYGGSTADQTQSSSLIGGLCARRPWSEGLMGGLLPATLFDGLCQRFGYQVGQVPAPSTGVPSNTNTPVRRPTITITQDPAPSSAETVELHPEVDIWANPASVRLGSRTYIFWNTRDVDENSCKESGPNFSHNTPSGGASTIPLSDASTFTIECQTMSGEPITDSVVVNLAL